MPENINGAGRLRADTGWQESLSSFTLLLYYVVPVVTLLLARGLLPVTICDDAFITFKVAANFASGLGMVFNPGEDTCVSTSPAWVLLLSASRWLIGDVVLAAKTLGAVFEILLVLSIVYLGARTGSGPVAGMFAALLLVTNPVFLLTSFSGMELPLYLLVIALTALSLSRHQYVVAMALGAGAVWIRFDGIVVFAVAVVIFLWQERQQIRRRPAGVLVAVMPAAAILLAYILFGAVFCETWLPMSVQRKALTTTDFLSPAWLDAASLVSHEFFNAVLGKSAYWYTRATAFPLMLVAFAIGVVWHIRHRWLSAAPLFLITIVYVCAFTFSGSNYAVNFPWYFVPVLPVVYLVCGAGIAWALSAVEKKTPFLQGANRVGALPAVVVVCWLALSITPLKGDADELVYRWQNERERVYASAAVWAGKYIGDEVVVAANEIGAIGFFLPPHASMLDMFGLLSRKDQLQVSFVQRIGETMPHCIFTRSHFSYTRTIRSELQDVYRWFSFRALNVGIRSDMVAALQPHLTDFHSIYETLDIDSEYLWNSDSGKSIQATGGSYY